MYLETLAHIGKALLKLAEEAEKLNKPEEASKTYLEKARETFDTILDKNAACHEAHQYLGLVLHKLAKYAENHNELEEAVKLWEEALDSNYDVLVAYQHLGLDYTKLAKDKEEKIAFLEKADKAFDQVLQRLIKVPTSILCSSTYLDTCINKFNNLIELAKYEEEYGKKPQEEKYWQKIYQELGEALIVCGNNPRLLNIASQASLNLAEKALICKEFASAQSLLVKAYSFEKALGSNNDFNRLVRIGKGFLKVDNPQEALIALNKALEVRPNDADTYYNKSLAYKQLADEAKKPNNSTEELVFLKKALENVEKSLAINPKVPIVFSHHGKTEINLYNLKYTNRETPKERYGTNRHVKELVKKFPQRFTEELYKECMRGPKVTPPDEVYYEQVGTKSIDIQGKDTESQDILDNDLNCDTTASSSLIGENNDVE